MGGHGGLNILPQKRWNVYNRDNRLKVSRDEAAAREKEEAEAAAAQQAESEFRHQRLLRRAQARAGAAGDVQLVQDGLQQLQQITQQADPLAASGLQQQQQQQAVVVQGGEQRLEHINFWREDELQAKAQHPEVEAAKREEARKRGKQDCYTSDPKFDERFQFAYGIKGNEPWWTRSQPSTASAPAAAPDTQPAGSAQQLLLPAGPGSNGARAELLQGPAQAALPAVEGHGDERNGRRKRRHSDHGKRDEEDEGVAAARQFLKQALGDQLPADLLASSDDEGGSTQGSGSSSSSGSDDSSSTSSTSSSSSDDDSSRRARKRRRREAGKGEDRKRSRSSTGSKRSRHDSKGKDKRHDRHKKGRHEDSSSKKRHKVKGSRHRKERRDSSSAGVLRTGSLGASFKSVEQLRLERLEREAVERSRTRLVLVGAEAAQPSDVPGQYHSGFGHAAALKKHHR